MGPVKPLGVVLGLLGNIAIGWGIFVLLQSGECGNPGQAACGSDQVTAMLVLVGGIAGSILATFLGGSWISFSGTFLAVGIGSIAAGVGQKPGEMQQFCYVFGGFFVFGGLAPAVLMASLRRMATAKRAQAARLVATGTKGVGTVTEVNDTGITINDDPRVEIVMRVDPVAGGPSVTRRKTVTVSRVAIPRVGERYPVWFDPADESAWAFGTDVEASAAPEVRRLFAQARGGAPRTAAPLAAEGAADADDPLDEIDKLDRLRRRGALTDAEYDDAKARLLARVGRD